MRIVETHHHLWDLGSHYYPWLTDHILPKLYGDYTPIRRDYLIGDYLADIGSLPVAKSVHVNAGFDPRRPVAETEWLQAIADDTQRSRGFPHGIVGDADLTAPDAGAVLEGHCRFANMRGIRQILSGIVTDPANHPDITLDRNWRGGIALLRRFGLSLDLQIHPLQMPLVAGLARENPELQLVICHAGMPIELRSGRLDLWREGMRQLAELPNIALKISGLGMFDTHWTPASIRPVVLEAIDIFGTERTMFGTNYPVDSLFSDYVSIWRAYDGITAGLSEAARERLFAGNAERIYRL